MEETNVKEKNNQRASYWNNHINNWKDSGLSQIDYCRKNNLSRHRFTYWKIKNTKKRSPVTFIPIVSKASATPLNNSRSPLKVQIGDKYRIEVGEGFSGETLSRLIKTLSDL